MSDLVSVNGRISSPEEAVISVYDRGFLFGDAVYEVTRSYGKVLFALEAHIERLENSANSIGMELGASRDQIIRDMYALTEKARFENAYIRIQVSRGNCAFQQVSLKPSNTGSVNTVMYLHQLQDWDPKYYQEGISLATTAVTRNLKSAMDPNIKSGNYLNNILGLVKMSEAADDCILLNEDGSVTEGSTFNVLMVKEGKVVSPPDSANILKGITRNIVFKLCEELGIEVEQRFFSLDEILTADEVFTTSATKEVMPVGRINQQNYQNVPGPVTATLMKAYKDYVREYCKEAEGVHPIAW